MRTYDHDSDALGRRTKFANTGTTFSTNRFSLWGYNDRSELTSAKRFDCNTSGSCLTDSNTNSPVSGQQFTYTFDNIGNRTEDTGDLDANTTGYTANNLNQYTATTSPTESFAYDNDGNLTQDGSWDYTWDAENRLITITARNPTSGSKKLGFDYDHMNRRVRKRVYTWNTFGLGFWNTTPSVDRKFVYDGWNLIEELNGLSSDAIITRFTWGLDLSGQSGSASVAGIHGAGGIGGLLACNDNSGSKNYLYFYNTNGDVGQLMDVAGGTSTPAVKYEYYPYGGELLASGLAALVSPFRFSTKYWDAETQNLYYGERYLRPKMGRWVSREPLGERVSLNLLTLVGNDPVEAADVLGRYPLKGVRRGGEVGDGENRSVAAGLKALCVKECKCCCTCVRGTTSAPSSGPSTQPAGTRCGPSNDREAAQCRTECAKECDEDIAEIESAILNVKNSRRRIGDPPRYTVPQCQHVPSQLMWELGRGGKKLRRLACMAIDLQGVKNGPKGPTYPHSAVGCSTVSCPRRTGPNGELSADFFIDPTRWNSKDFDEDYGFEDGNGDGQLDRPTQGSITHCYGRPAAEWDKHKNRPGCPFPHLFDCK